MLLATTQTVSVRFANDLLQQERSAHEAEVARLRAQVDQLSRDRAILTAERDQLQAKLLAAGALCR